LPGVEDVDNNSDGEGTEDKGESVDSEEEILGDAYSDDNADFLFRIKRVRRKGKKTVMVMVMVAVGAPAQAQQAPPPVRNGATPHAPLTAGTRGRVEGVGEGVSRDGDGT
jgi:hypothetical protein